jgi:regulator of replication initiation timing
MQSDINAYKRITKRTKSGGIIIVPIEKIKEEINNIITENKNLNINDEYIEDVLQKIDPIKAQSINPGALVLASTVIKQNKIDLKTLNKNINAYTENVEKIDIIRYAKFLILLSDI